MRIKFMWINKRLKINVYLELSVEVVEVSSSPGVTVDLLRLLDVRVKLYETVGSGRCVDLVPVLTVKL